MGIYDIGIIGGGTAGMTAAIYGQRAGKQTVLFEGTTFGGQITSSPNVENYPGIASVSGSEFSMNLMDQAVKHYSCHWCDTPPSWSSGRGTSDRCRSFILCDL